jgi:hypothetical protein
VVAAACGVALSTVAVPRFAGSLLRAPGSQAVELAATGRALRDESYARTVKSARRAAAWRQERRDLVELGLVHFNRGSRAPAGSAEQAGYYAQSLAALHESLELSPVQPVAWLLVAGTRDWCVGFMLGVGTVGREAWFPILLSEGRQILQPILACTELGRTMLPDVEANTIEQIRDVAHQHIGDAVVRLYGYSHRKRGRRQRPSGRRSS